MQKLRPAFFCICLLIFGYIVPRAFFGQQPNQVSQPGSGYVNAAALPTQDPSPTTPVVYPTLPALPTVPPATPTDLPTLEPTAFPIATQAPSLPIAFPTLIPLTSTSTALDTPYDLCADLAMPRCLSKAAAEVPAAPAGYSWKRLDGRFTFSAYAHPSEDYYLGNMVDIPGVQNIQAKEDFLYGVDGIGMQGGGYVWGKDMQLQLRPYYIRFISGHWELDGEDVTISNEWHFKETGKIVEPHLVSKIRLADAQFAIDKEPDVTPYYSVAAGLRFKTGTKIYVPGLTQYGGSFEVQDTGGAFWMDNQRFDLFVGKEMADAVNFIRLGPARSDLVVYALEPD